MWRRPLESAPAKRRLVLIANRVEARLLTPPVIAKEPQVFSHLEHPLGRLHDQELKDAKPGRAFESRQGAHARHALSPEVSPHEQDAVVFARRIGKELKAARLKGFNDLVLVAEPRFLGMVLDSLDDQTRQNISETVKKDLGYLTDKEAGAYFF